MKLWRVSIDDVDSDTEVSATRISDLLTFLGVGQHYERIAEYEYMIELPNDLNKIMEAGGLVQFTWNNLIVGAEVP